MKLRLNFNKRGIKQIIVNIHKDNENDMKVLNELLKVRELKTMSISDYIKERILGNRVNIKNENVKKVNAEAIAEIRKIINPIANNINQIAKVLNTFKKENHINENIIETAIEHLNFVHSDMNKIYNIFIKNNVRNLIIKSEKINDEIDKKIFSISDNKIDAIFNEISHSKIDYKKLMNNLIKNNEKIE